MIDDLKGVPRPGAAVAVGGLGTSGEVWSRRWDVRKGFSFCPRLPCFLDISWVRVSHFRERVPCIFVNATTTSCFPLCL
jgi:hypothetical protein